MSDNAGCGGGLFAKSMMPLVARSFELGNGNGNGNVHGNAKSSGLL